MNMSYFANSSDDETYDGGDIQYYSESETETNSLSDSNSASETGTNSLSDSDSESEEETSSTDESNPLDGLTGGVTFNMREGVRQRDEKRRIRGRKRSEEKKKQDFIPQLSVDFTILSKAKMNEKDYLNYIKEKDYDPVVRAIKIRGVVLPSMKEYEKIKNIIFNIDLKTDNVYKSNILKLMYILTHEFEEVRQDLDETEKEKIIKKYLENKTLFIKFLMDHYDYYSNPEPSDNIHDYYSELITGGQKGGSNEETENENENVAVISTWNPDQPPEPSENEKNEEEEVTSIDSDITNIPKYDLLVSFCNILVTMIKSRKKFEDTKMIKIPPINNIEKYNLLSNITHNLVFIYLCSNVEVEIEKGNRVFGDIMDQNGSRKIEHTIKRDILLFNTIIDYEKKIDERSQSIINDCCMYNIIPYMINAETSDVIQKKYRTKMNKVMRREGPAQTEPYKIEINKPTYFKNLNVFNEKNNTNNYFNSSKETNDIKLKKILEDIKNTKINENEKIENIVDELKNIKVIIMSWLNNNIKNDIENNQGTAILQDYLKSKKTSTSVHDASYEGPVAEQKSQEEDE